MNKEQTLKIYNNSVRKTMKFKNQAKKTEGTEELSKKKHKYQDTIKTFKERSERLIHVEEPE